MIDVMSTRSQRIRGAYKRVDVANAAIAAATTGSTANTVTTSEIVTLTARPPPKPLLHQQLETQLKLMQQPSMQCPERRVSPPQNLCQVFHHPSCR